nr:protein EXECUTER 1, chloroplastic-like [Ipomoea batatas]
MSLDHKFNSYKLLRLPISCGIRPLMLQFATFKIWRVRERLPIAFGRIAFKGLYGNTNIWMYLQFANEVIRLNFGSVVRLFSARIRFWSCAKFPREFGMKPVNWLVLSSRITRLEAFEIWGGITPPILVLERDGVSRPLLRTSLSPVTYIPARRRLRRRCQSQLAGYIRVDYEGATRLKVAIADAATNHTVGKVKSHFNVEILESVGEVADCIWEHSV